MGAIVVRRLLASIPVIFVVSIGVFMLVALIPGDPAIVLAGGVDATPERIEEIRQELGLNNPLPVQYWHWLTGAVQGDLGASLVSNQPVVDTIWSKLPITLSLAVVALVIGVILSLVFGLVSGLYAGRPTDRLIVLGASAGLAMPGFWLAMILISLFAIRWQVLPVGGFVSLTDDPAEWFRHLVMPALSLAVLVAAVNTRQLRASIIDAMSSSYVRTAWGKGAGVGRVVSKHALKNAAMPVVTVLGLQVGALIGGSVIIEQIFSLPGLGTYLLQAVSTSDLPVIQGVVLLFALIQILIMLIVDLTYSFLNPKVRVS